MGSSEPLFDQMISISGPGGVPYKNSSEAQTFYESIAGNLGCCGRANIGNENFGKCEPGLRPGQPAIPDDFVECLLGKTTQEIQVSLVIFSYFEKNNMYFRISYRLKIGFK